MECGHHEFDKLILRTLIIDGEVFIRIHHPNNKYGLSFELIDSMSVNYAKIREAANGTNAIVLGVEIDNYGAPVKYYLKHGNSTCYMAGKEEEVPAPEIIHIFKKEFPLQARGYSILNAAIQPLKQLADYNLAEIVAAKTGAMLAFAYERNSQPEQGKFRDENLSDEEDKGTFTQALEPGQATIVPAGYNMKSISSAHPHSNFDAFTKSVTKKVAASLGVSYNSLTKDVESVNYSSLRSALIDERSFYEDMQTFLINSWKDIEFELFIKAAAMNGSIPGVKASELNEVLRQHTFICHKMEWVDPVKDVAATSKMLELGLTNPLMCITERGFDVDEVLKGWAQWNTLLKQYGVSFSKEKEALPLPDTGEKPDDEVMQQERD